MSAAIITAPVFSSKETFVWLLNFFDNVSQYNHQKTKQLVKVAFYVNNSCGKAVLSLVDFELDQLELNVKLNSYCWM